MKCKGKYVDLINFNKIIIKKDLKTSLVLARHLGSLRKFGFSNSQSDLALVLGLVGMNFHAKYYPHWDIAYTKDFSCVMNMSPQQICEHCQLHNISNIILTYTEPLLSLEFVIDLSKCIYENNLQLYISTNGYFPRKTLLLLAKKAIFTNLEINLHSVRESFYKRLAHIDVSIIKSFCRQAQKYNLPISIKSLIIDQENDGRKDLQKLAEFIYNLNPQTLWNLRTYDPDYKLLDKKQTPFLTIKKALLIGKNVGLMNIRTNL